MACPSGMHQHLGAKGRMLACHPKSQIHTSEKTRQYHEMALQYEKGSRTTSDEFGEENEKRLIDPDQKKKIQANAKVIRQALNKLTRGRFKALFVPLTGLLVAYDGMVNNVHKYKEKAKTKREKMMADAYAEAVDRLVDKVPLSDSDWSEGTVKKLRDSVEADLETYRNVIKQKGKNCPEYGKYIAYRDYMALCDERMGALHNRIQRERLMSGKKNGGTAVRTGERKKVTPKTPPKKNTGRMPTKEEVLAKYGFMQLLKHPKVRTSNPYNLSGKSRRK